MPHRDPGNDSGSPWRPERARGIFVFMSAPTSNTTASLAPATRLASSLARELERLATTTPTFDEMEIIVASAKRLVTTINGARYRLPGAPTATSTKATSKPTTKARRGRATLPQEAPATSAPSL
jgi:hypothetical protein